MVLREARRPAVNASQQAAANTHLARREPRAVALEAPGVASRQNTLADREGTSTSQTKVPACSKPSTVTTACGTVTFSDPDPRTVRAARDSKRVDTDGQMANSIDNGIGQPDLGMPERHLKYSRQNRPSNWPNMAPPYSDQNAERTRAARMLAARPDSVLKVGEQTFRVRSEGGGGSYAVERTRKGWICECEAFEERRICKHIWCVKIELKPAEFESVEPAPESEGKRYPRGPEYAAARKREATEFGPLLWDLLRSVDEPPRRTCRVGRPRNSLRAQLYHATWKVYQCASQHWVYGELRRSLGSPGVLARILNDKTPSTVFNNESTAETLLRLIELSAAPFRELEDCGTLAIDSTGFSTTVRGAYSTEKHDPLRKHRWNKGHLIIGTKTHVIAAVAVTDERGADSPQFIPLVQKAIAAGFRPSKVVADKAYVSRDAYQLLVDLGIDGYLPFRDGMTDRAEGCYEWHRKVRQFVDHRAEFDREYHARSNVESVNSSLKRRFMEGLLSKNQGAQFNEVLAKILAYNIVLLIHYSHKVNIEFFEGGEGELRQISEEEATPASSSVILSEPEVDSGDELVGVFE